MKRNRPVAHYPANGKPFGFRPFHSSLELRLVPSRGQLKDAESQSLKRRRSP